jgi:hypothetical protein
MNNTIYKTIDFLIMGALCAYPVAGVVLVFGILLEKMGWI